MAVDPPRDIDRVIAAAVDGSVHIPVHTLHDRIHEIPDGQVWAHCGSGSGLRAAVAASHLDAAGRDVGAVDDPFTGAERAGLVVRTR